MGRVAVLLLAAGMVAPGCSRSEAPPRESPWPLHAHPGDCRQCHGSLSGGIASAPPPPQVCSTSGCHRSLEPPPRLVHGPVATGDCRACHVPHSSVAPHLVLGAAPRICAGCHDRLYTCPAAGAPASSDCIACHQPHGGARGFLRPSASGGAASD